MQEPDFHDSKHRRVVALARSCAFGEAFLILSLHARQPPDPSLDPLTVGVRRDTFGEIIAYVKKEFEQAQKELGDE